MAGRTRWILLASGLLAMGSAAAHGGESHAPARDAEQLVAARQGGMTMSVMTLGTVSAAAGTEGSLARVAFPASGLAAFAEALPVLYGPETAPVAGTRALPAVWSDWTGFLAQADEFRQATAALSAAASADDRPAFDAALARTKAACQSCHDSFRAEAA